MKRYSLFIIVIIILGMSFNACVKRYKMPPLITPEIDYSDSVSVRIYSKPNNYSTNLVSDTIQLDSYPEMIYETIPDYPKKSEKAGIIGLVYVTALVDEEGNVIDATVRKSTGHLPFDESAVRGAYKNKFKPGIQNGNPIKVWVTYKVEFVLGKK